MNRVTTMRMVALASVLVFAGIAAAQAEASPLFLCSAAEGLGGGLFTSTETNSFDLQTCQRDCAIDHGVEPWFRGGGGDARWYMYTSCVQDCNRKFWKEYDKEMRDLEKDTK